MTEDSLKSMIEETLAIPVFLGQESIIYPSATLETTVITPGIYGDGKSVRRTHEVYINLWYEDKDTRDTARDTLMAVLDQVSGITSPDVESYYDTTAKKFRAVFSLYLIPEYTDPE